MGDKRLRILVTGGAGYIGSHIVRDLMAQQHDVAVYDNLYSGNRWAVMPPAELITGDLGDRSRLESLLSGRGFDAVIHCAGHIWVGESMRNPAKYYFVNASNAFRLFDLCGQYGIKHIVFSSTAAVYGQPDVEQISEEQPTKPINPYGMSKLMAEQALHDLARASNMTYAVLRYFNVAGADADARIGEATPDNSHLIKVACETAFGLRKGMHINGNDYPTLDGTCVRDYVHVDDLAAAHIKAIDHLVKGGSSITVNCGYGHGFSVREVLDKVRKVTGVDFPIDEGPRRPGDPAVLIADASKIRNEFGWQPQHDDLDSIVTTAWRWEQKLQEMKASLALAG